MARRVTHRVIDRGWDRISREIHSTVTTKPHVAVGIFGKDAQRREGVETNLEIGVIHEFGLTYEHPGGTAYVMENGRARFVSNEAAQGLDLPRTKPHQIKVPERSFIRDTVDLNRGKISKKAKQLFRTVLLGRLTKAQALEVLGLYVQGLIRARMSKGIPPPNKPATIRRKGSATPLIDTGQLRASINIDVRNANR